MKAQASAPCRWNRHRARRFPKAETRGTGFRLAPEGHGTTGIELVDFLSRDPQGRDSGSRRKAAARAAPRAAARGGGGDANPLA